MTAAANPAPNDAHSKALAINLSTADYGTFAEIGAGQEVARWFLRVGGASGTVAQTISAYDKTFSDHTYGSGTRYVSRDRLLDMLEREFGLLLNRLGSARGAETRFFAFADTVAARNYKGDNEQHGWMGIRFQNKPGSEPSDILLHINMMDTNAQLQQEAVGLLGVNLVYGAIHHAASEAAFVSGLFDGLSIGRLEIDVIELRGPAFRDAEARRWCLRALRSGMAHALVFDAQVNVVEPSSLLRKRPLIVERGRFDTFDPYQATMLHAAQQQLRAEGIECERDPAPVLEMSLRHVDGSPGPDDADILARTERLAKFGAVVVSDYPQTYLLVQYLRRHTAEPVRFVVGASGLAQLLHRAHYEELPGSLLEGLGRFLATNVKIYCSAMPADVFRRLIGNSMPEILAAAPTTGMVTADDIHPPPPVSHLYAYLRESGKIVPLSQ